MALAAELLAEELLAEELLAEELLAETGRNKTTSSTQAVSPAVAPWFSILSLQTVSFP